MTLRIAHVTCDPGVREGATKGAAVHLAAMRHAFAALGAEVVALDARDDAAARARLEALHAETPLHLVYERLALRASAVGAFAAARALPHVVEVNAPLDEEDARHRGGSEDARCRQQLGETLRGAALVIAVSTAVADWARARGADPARVVVEPNGVDAARFHPGLREAGRRRLGLARETFAVGFHGRLRPWHRVDRIGAAVATLRQRGHDAVLVTLGHGEFAEALAGALPRDAWRALEWVPHDDVGPIVAAFDALPLGYDVDQPCYFSPLKLREAMAAGVVPVVPDLGDLAAEVGHGEAGLIVDPRAPHALADALEVLVTDPVRRARLAAAAVPRGAAQSWQGIAARVLDRVGVTA